MQAILQNLGALQPNIKDQPHQSLKKFLRLQILVEGFNNQR
jgi:hypothetical protein